MSGRRRAVVAIGGNSLIKDKEHQSVRDQYIAAGETCWHIASMIEDGWDVAIGHGNGPQVGFILRRSELAAHELHEVPLDVCGADSQGAIGYALAQNLENDFRRLGMDRHAVAVVTQVEVAADDPAFDAPDEADRLVHGRGDGERRRDAEGWAVVRGRGSWLAARRRLAGSRCGSSRRTRSGRCSTKASSSSRSAAAASRSSPTQTASSPASRR